MVEIYLQEPTLDNQDNFIRTMQLSQQIHHLFNVLALEMREWHIVICLLMVCGKITCALHYLIMIGKFQVMMKPK